jgi:hypothetical protein
MCIGANSSGVFGQRGVREPDRFADAEKPHLVCAFSRSIFRRRKAGMRDPVDSYPSTDQRCSVMDSRGSMDAAS